MKRGQAQLFYGFLFVVAVILHILLLYTDVVASCSQNEMSISMNNETHQSDVEEELLNDKVSINHEDPFPIPTTGRLPTSLFPNNYTLALKVYLQNETYDGSVKILFVVENETNKIVLNMVDIVTKNESTKVLSVSGEEFINDEIPILSQTYDVSLQFFIITLNKTLIPGDFYEVHVEFRGTLNSKLVGFYLSTYKDARNRDIRVASTQFSPTDARRAFPCFDEPKFKATFTISIERDKDVFALSNMPVVETKFVNGTEDRYIDRFDTTVKMSTYVVGFLVSDFVNKTSPYMNETILRVWTRENAIEQSNYALSVAPKLLKFLQDYFEIDYPLPKLDMAAIPDFKFNGMENWGLIMYRESALLFDPQLTTVDGKRRIMQVVAHEIAHMWFGNLVTPEWWSDLWLKEGFANFMGYKAADHVEQPWKMMENVVWSTMQSAFALDSLHSSHPVNVNVSQADRISEIFDAISYNKGTSIIRMMQHFLSESVYKKGMRSYVRELQYKNAVQEDLWYHLDEAWKESKNISTGPSLQDIMETWTLQEGFPVVNVRRNYSKIFLNQERFLMGENCEWHPTADSNNCSEEQKEGVDSTFNSSATERWWIPISLAEGTLQSFDHTEPKVWMNPEVNETTMNVSDHEWFVLNVQRSGFFRVNYDNSTWHLLLKQLQSNHSVIHHLNRVQILDDAMKLARIGVINYSLALEMTTYMENEIELGVWSVFLSNFAYMYKFIEFTPQSTSFKKYLAKLVSPLYEMSRIVDERNDSYSNQSLRVLSSEWACRIGYKPCLTTASKLFLEWLDSTESERSRAIPVNVKPTVLCSGIKSTSRAEWNATFNAYMKSNIQTEKADILIALGCTEDVDTLNWYLAQTLNSSSDIIKQDVSYVFGGVSQTLIGSSLAWNLIKDNWRFFVQTFGSGSSALWRIFEAPTSAFNSNDLLEELLTFREKEEQFLGSAQQTVDRAIEETRFNIMWTETYFPQVMKWMENFE